MVERERAMNHTSIFESAGRSRRSIRFVGTRMVERAVSVVSAAQHHDVH